MPHVERDLSSPELWQRSLERSMRRRALLPRARREQARRRGASVAMATATLAGPGAPLAAARAAGEPGVAVESREALTIEVKAGGLPLRIGSQGELVARVQHALGITADAIFGPETDGAVRRFQYASHLQVDGVVGPATWSALFAPTRTAARADAAVGGSEVPVRVRRKIEQRLAAAGVELAGEARGESPTGDPQGRGERQSATTGGGPLPGGDVTAGDCGSARISSPVGGPVTSGFGPRWGRNHDGIDIGAAAGTAVRAAACGVVTVRGQQGGYGNIVC